MLNIIIFTCEESRSKISGRVDSVATVVTKADTNSEDSETNEEWNTLLGDLHVPPVSDGADTEQEQSSDHHLVNDTT